MKKKTMKVCSILSCLLLTTLTALDGCSTPAVVPEVQAKGRYVENTIELPYEQTTGEYVFSQLDQKEDGSIVLYYKNFEKTGGISTYDWDGSNWNKRAGEIILPETEAGIEIIKVEEKEDGTQYVLYTDWADYNENHEPDVTSIFSRIVKKTPDGIESQPIETALKAQERLFYFKVLDDESILVSTMEKALLFDAGGDLMQTFLEGYSYNASARQLIVANSTDLVTVGPEGKNLVRYGVETGRIEEEIPLTNLEEGTLIFDEKDNLYLCNSEGIHYWNNGGSMWETLADGSLNSLSSPSIFFQQFAHGKENDFYAFVSDLDKYQLLRYTYDAEMPSVPSEILSIFGLSDSATIRQAISLFQKYHPDVRVEYQIGDSGNAASATVTDTIKALNTELLSKKGADVLILDGLPIEDYIDKGVLMDLSSWLNPMISAGSILPNVVGGEWQRDGGIYGVPIHFRMAIVYGNVQGIKALASLDSLANYQIAANELPLFSGKNEAEQLRLLINLYFHELFPNGEKEISEERLQLLLETTKKLYEDGKAGKDIEPGNMLDNFYEQNSNNGFNNSDFILFHMGDISTQIVLISGRTDLLVPVTLMEQNKLEPQTINGLYIPQGIAGINQASNNKELATEFIQFLLSEEAQNVDFTEGLPVNSNSLNNNKEIENDMSIGYSADNFSLTAGWPSKDWRTKVYNLTNELTTPIYMDKVLAEMIENEASPYFKGEVDGKKAAAEIAKKAQIYFAE